MDISRLVMSSIGRRDRKRKSFEPPSFGDDSEMSKFDKLIARAARSWNTDFPGRKELPRKYAKICWETTALARSKQRSPEDILHEVCRIILDKRTVLRSDMPRIPRELLRLK